MNNISAFEDMWKEIILKAIKLCKNELDEEFKNRTNFNVVDLEKYKLQLENIYKRKRRWLKSEYLPNEEKPTLDFHKLSSIMCRSIIGIKPFVYDIQECENMFSEIVCSNEMSQFEKIQWQINNVYINYKLAFLVAEGIVFVDLLFWAQDKIDSIQKKENRDNQKDVDQYEDMLAIYKEFISLLTLQDYRLYKYKTSSLHDDFITSSIVALMKNDFLNRDFDYLQFSISMFQWQEYTKKQYLYDLLSKNNYNLKLSDIV